ncbi:MAG: T9SS type A sorting domain-containing protein, partial [Bacteroidota bacterium]
ILTSLGCSSPSQNDAGVTVISDPDGMQYCSNTLSPKITLKNFGTNTITNVTINYGAGNYSNSHSWAGSLASGASTTVSLTPITVTDGAYSFKVKTSMPNGSTDPVSANDSTSSSLQISTLVKAIPFSESFESTVFPPAQWNLNNPDKGITWARTTSAAKMGVASAWMDTWNYTNGPTDELISPLINLTTGASLLTFQVAYTYYTLDGSESDTLQVLISTDCGNTYTSIYKKTGDQLRTAPPSQVIFVPTANQWRMESISLSAYTSCPNALIKFRHISDYENDMYLDDINISSSTSLEENFNSAFTIYPNPGNGNITVSLGELQEIGSIQITNIIGQNIEKAPVIVAKNLYTYDLSDLPAGIYFVTLYSDKASAIQKLIIQ